MSDWAEKVLDGVPRHNAQDAKSMTGYAAAVWLHEDAVVDAIAKLGAGGDDLAALLALDDIELYRAIKTSGAKKRIDIARAVIQHLEPRETTLFAHIAALTKEREQWRRAAETRAKGWKISDDARIEAEAKLEKAVKGLKRICMQPDYRLPSLQEIARTTLAEIKGESDE